MLSLWIVRIIVLMLTQIITSFLLIYHGKNKLSFFTEIALCFCSLVYFHAFFIELICLYILEYICTKILIVIIVWAIRRFSFYVLVKISHQKTKSKKINSRSFFAKHFLRFVSHMWRKVDYGIRIKKGRPSMVNKKHVATGVRFDKDGFPCFKAIATITLDKSLYKKNRSVHFYHANKLLYAKIQRYKSIASKFTRREIMSFSLGETPAKYTWHHHQDKGVMQLVDREIHEAVSHDGGYSIWGKRK